MEWCGVRWGVKLIKGVVRWNCSCGEGIDWVSEWGGFDFGEGVVEVDEIRCCSKWVVVVLLFFVFVKYVDVVKVNYLFGGLVFFFFLVFVFDRFLLCFCFGEMVVCWSGFCCIFV